MLHAVGPVQVLRPDVHRAERGRGVDAGRTGQQAVVVVRRPECSVRAGGIHEGRIVADVAVAGVVVQLLDAAVRDGGAGYLCRLATAQGIFVAPENAAGDRQRAEPGPVHAAPDVARSVVDHRAVGQDRIAPGPDGTSVDDAGVAGKEAVPDPATAVHPATVDFECDVAHERATIKRAGLASHVVNATAGVEDHVPNEVTVADQEIAEVVRTDAATDDRPVLHEAAVPDRDQARGHVDASAGVPGERRAEGRASGDRQSVENCRLVRAQCSHDVEAVLERRRVVDVAAGDVVAVEIAAEDRLVGRHVALVEAGLTADKSTVHGYAAAQFEGQIAVTAAAVRRIRPGRDPEIHESVQRTSGLEGVLKIVERGLPRRAVAAVGRGGVHMDDRTGLRAIVDQLRSQRDERFNRTVALARRKARTAIGWGE